MNENQDLHWMARALALAEQAAALNEVPVGAVVVLDGQVIGEGWNQPISGHDPTAHAEIMALRDAAAKTGNYRLAGATLYVTIEPCTMCAGAIVHARIKRVVFGAVEPKAGAVVSNSQLFGQSWLNHWPEFTGDVMAEQCSEAISQFFRRRRAEKKALKLAAKAIDNKLE
ncbi:tRNA adenosine(34) deaminase TadA [Amphritea sp. 2_MG-2023]|nr:MULTISPECIES: tRNA adenosine(34) deaminase TadA [Amphritea]MBU2965090.1 tRNA adenosine(34) deaminase TadA [Amphritea atlantica]MDO6418875.1 tRNA adenosine(34) deaminase TadA [Amphritea sp. 2_MG-2023]